MPDYSKYPNWFWQLPASQRAYYGPQIEAGLAQAAQQEVYRQNQGLEVVNPAAFSGIPSMDAVSNARNAFLAGQLSKEEADALNNARFGTGFATLGVQARVRPDITVYTSRYGNIPAGELYQRLAAEGYFGKNPTPVWEIPVPENVKEISGLSNWVDPWAAELSKRNLTAKTGTWDQDREFGARSTKALEEEAERTAAWEPGSDAWYRRQNQEGMWAPDYKWDLDREPDRTTVAGPADVAWLNKVREQNPEKFQESTSTPSGSTGFSSTPQTTSNSQQTQPATSSAVSTTPVTTPATTQSQSVTTAPQTVDPTRVRQVTWSGPDGATYGALLKRSEQLQFKNGQWVAPEGAPVYKAAPGQPLTFPGYGQNPTGQLVNPPTTTPQTPVTPQITIPKAVTERRESFAPAPDASPDSPQIQPQQPAVTPRIAVPQAALRQTQTYSPSASSVVATSNAQTWQPYISPQPAAVNLGSQIGSQRQVYNSAGPQITLPAAITNQLPKTLIPTQGTTPTMFAAQSAFNAPTAPQQFRPPKSIPIPDLSQFQSQTPSANNLFSTINGLQNRSITTAPKISGFYGGFY